MININNLIASIEKVISGLYTDSVDIYRNQEYVSEYGDVQAKKTLIHSKISARCDPWMPDDLGVTNEIQEDKTNLKMLVILSTSYEVRKGDWFVIRRLGKNSQTLQVYEGKANEPQIYPSHQEIIIDYKD